MDALKRKRTQQRREFTLAADEVKNDLDAKAKVSQVQISFASLAEIADALFSTEESLRNTWLQESEFCEEIYQADQDKAATYRKRWVSLKVKYEQLVNAESKSSRSSAGSTCRNGSDSEQEDDKKRRYKLPLLELAKFDGSIRKWMPFWGQFRKIHMDKSLDNDDKFQYLLQSMTPESSARQLVESYPPYGDNYIKAVEALKSRFARDEILIETYVRDLLSLVLLQAKGQQYDLRTLYDKLQTQLQSLETLGVTKDKYAAMLMPMVESALPEDLLKTWNRSKLTTDMTNTDELNKLLTFLKREAESEERIEMSRFQFRDVASTSSRPPMIPTLSCFSASKGEKKEKDKVKKDETLTLSCLWCDKGSHSSSECYKAAKMTLEERMKTLSDKKACQICMKIGHLAKRCRSFPKCLYCKKRHVTLLCPELYEVAKDGKLETTNLKNEVMLCKKESTTLLPTLLVRISQDEKSVIVRALIDSGAQRSYVRLDVAEKLHMKPVRKERMSHGLFGGAETQNKEYFVFAVNIRSTDNVFASQILAVGEKTICSSLPKLVSEEVINKLSRYGIVLTENTETCSDDIDLLIGADYSGLLLTGDIVQLDNNMTAVKTQLGWTLQGKMTGSFGNNITNLFCTSKIDITDLWNLETLGIKDPIEYSFKYLQDLQILDSFKRTIRVDDEGRYEVQLPWRNVPRPQSNFELARKRLDSTHKRLKRLGKVEQYDSVFKEWLSLNIIEEAPNSDIFTGHYISHHAVIKESSLTTKIRPVFDASAKDRYGVSLNSCLEKGPNLLELIPKLLIDFRKEAIGVTADIAKAFLQISLFPDDREYLKFLWLAADESVGQKKLITYRHKRVVFGVTSSPFHLVATIAHHLESSPKQMKTTAEKLKNSFYVDNCVTSVANENDMHDFIKVSQELMNNGKFDLRQWVTAPIRVNREIEDTSVLGILWNTKSDDLRCNIGTVEDSGVYTKRSLLSATQTIFDPIGIVSPFTIIPKMIMQRCWSRKLSWDAELPSDLASDFKTWLKDIHLLNKCTLPRRLTCFTVLDSEIELHTFCDASKFAYATCIFLRSKYREKVTLSLVFSKSRVTPAKRNVSIPRLELLACLLGVRLCKQAIEALKMPNLKTYFWTDSSVALTWIKADNDWGTFVNNRVREIRESSLSDAWNHISGSLNPADLPSRGINAVGLLRSKWWDGPSWLLTERQKWPATKFSVNDIGVNVERKLQINAVVSEKEHFLENFSYFSSYTKTIRMVAWIMRWKNKSKKSNNLSFEEIENAENIIIRLIQEKHYEKLVNQNNLVTFKDEKLILRLKTKLELGNDDPNFIFPIILPGKEPLIYRLVEERHRTFHHAGVQTLIVHLRETFWILGVRRLAKKVVKNCVRCERYKAKAFKTSSIGLPIDRIKDGKAFQVTGVDLAGPLITRNGDKCWIALFTCAIYRAVHLELVTSLSTDVFMMAIRRFVARRGRVQIIYSDNATNFRGLKNKMDTIDYNDIAEKAATYKIKWKNIPPGSPWWGGWWERLIGLMKQILRRILGRASVDYVELETILCDCESVINNRPLTYVTGDSEYLRPLTPKDFIQSLPCSSVSDFDAIDSKNLNCRYKYLQRLRDEFRQRFRNEYLATLLQKGQHKHASIRVGDVVLVETDDKRINWPLGLIIELIPGADGLVRVAKVKTATNYLTRPVQKLYPLEVTNDNKNFLTDCTSNINNQTQVDSDTNDGYKNINPTVPVTTRLGRVVKLPNRFY